MIHSVYFRFFQRTKCKWLSVILSYIVYAMFFFAYTVQRIRCKRHIVKTDPKEAFKTISKVYPDPGKKPLKKSTPVNNQLDLSIIMPVYNYVDLIENTIRSILNQKTQFRYELILVDDGSTDGAQDVLQNYKDTNGVKVYFQENQGIAGARNTGLNIAAGKYIMFIDCDDTVEDNLVETLMSKAYRGNCDITMCAHNLAKERKGRVYEIIPNIYSTGNLQGYAKEAEILNYAGLPWGKVYKRELWENVRFFPGYWYEDTIIHGLIFPQCRSFAYIPKVCYQYRWYEKNYSHVQGNSKDIRCIDIYWLIRSMLKQYAQLEFPHSALYETMLLKHLSFYYYSKIKDLDDELLEALFVLACELYKQYRVKSKCKLPYMLRVTKQALLRKDMNLWKLASMYQR